MASSFNELHKQVQFYWQEGCRIAKEKKDYGSAIELINDALNLVMEKKVFDDNYKNSRRYQFCRQLTLFALKSEMPEDALKYAQLCNRPDYIADAYFQNGKFEQCLTYYMAMAKPYILYIRDGHGLPAISYLGKISQRSPWLFITYVKNILKNIILIALKRTSHGYMGK